MKMLQGLDLRPSTIICNIVNMRMLAMVESHGAF